MILTNKIRNALKTSAVQHDGQHRKDGLTPFIIHPVEVAIIISEYTNNEDIICAALLHDILEDTLGYSVDKLRDNFGEKVTEIVSSLTDTPYPDLSWEKKHKKYLEVLRNSSDEAVLVCLADKYSNVSTGPVNPERVWYYQGVVDICKKRELIENIKLLKDFENIFSGI